MKKALLVFLVLFICLFVFLGCSKTPVDDDVTAAHDDTREHTEAKEEETEDEAAASKNVKNSDIKIIQYAWSGVGVSTKTISAGNLTNAIINELKKMTDTGETVPEISDKTIDEFSDELPVERGTKWIEVGSEIYRISSGGTQICRVNTHLGEGYVLNITEDFKTLLWNAWNYYPYNYYKGSYEVVTGNLTFSKVFDAKSTIQIDIKNIEIESGENPENKITLELVSTKNQTAEIWLDWVSDDTYYQGDIKMVRLDAWEEKEIELTFGGWDNSSFKIYFMADNTRLELAIDNRTRINYDYSDIAIGVKNGRESINPVQTLVWLNEYAANGETIVNADGAGCYQIFGDPRFKPTDLPAVVATDELTVTVPEASEIRSIIIYDLNCKPMEYEAIELSALHLLPAGEYIVVIYQITDSRVINPDAEIYSICGYDDVFRLIVPEKSVGGAPHSLTFNTTSPVSDDFDVNATYRAGETVAIPLETVTEQYYRVFANGEEIQMLSCDLCWSVFAFVMPDEDVYIEIQEVSVDIPEAR